MYYLTIRPEVVMYEEFLQTLNSFLGKERMSLIQSTLETLDRLGMESPWTEISLIYAGEDDLTGTELLERTEMILEMGINDVLNQHGVVCSGNLALKLKVVNFLEMVQNWSDGQGIVDIITNTAENAIGAFCDLFEYVTTESYTQIDQSIISVNFSLLDQIRKVAEETIQLKTGEIDLEYDPQERVRIVRRFAALHPDSLGIKLLKNNEVSIGFSLDNLIRTYGKEIYVYEPSDPKMAAVQMLSLVAISNVEEMKHVEMAKRSLDQIFGDDQFLSRVILEIDNLSFGLKQNG